MPLFIDTYNVLHTTGILPPELAGIDLESLISLISCSRYRSQKITLVCDGTGKGGKRLSYAKSITVKYSGPHKKADDLIVELLDKASDSRRIIVVTSDRAVARAAKTRRCATLTSQLFLEHLANDAQSKLSAKPPCQARSYEKLDDESVQQWLEEFALDESDLKRQAAPGNSPGNSPEPSPPENSPELNPATSSDKKKRKSKSIPKPKPKQRSGKPKKLDNQQAIPPKVIQEAQDMIDEDSDNR